MKILLFEPFLSTGEEVGGDAKQALRLASSLKNIGNEVEIIQFSVGKKAIYKDIKLLIKLINSNNETLDGDVLYSIGSPFCGALSSIVGKKLKIPTVHHVTHFSDFKHNTSEAKRLLKISYEEGGLNLFADNFYEALRFSFMASPERLKNFITYKLNDVDKVIASCEYVREKLSTYECLKEIPVIYPGFKINKISMNDSRNEPVIFYFGAFFSGRGVIDLIKSFYKITKLVPKMKLVISGYPIYEKATQRICNKLIEKYDLKNILIQNFRPNINEDIEKATIVCLPFRSDAPFQPPLTILEAMSNGKTLISTNIGAVPEFIIDKKTGFLISPGNINEISECILYAINNEEIIKNIGINAYEHVKSKCDIDKMTLKLNKIFKEVVSNY